MITGAHRYPLQEKVVYGWPAAEALSKLADEFGAERLLLVTTASLDRPEGCVADLRAALGARCVGLYSAIRAHSPREDVIGCAVAARAAKADLLVALGGGSVIDAVKAVQLCLWADLHDADALDTLRGRGALALTPGIGMVALPTTLSAAEFTPFAGVTDTARKAKGGFYHPRLAPRAVVLDPRLTGETPARLWFSTGMKAVDHAVEQLCHRRRAPYSDALAEDALRRLARGLSATKRDATDLEPRLDCQFGMWLSIAGASSGHGLGASHAIGHTLGGSYGVPHGITSCVILPAVLGWNEAADAARQGVVARCLGRPDLSAAAAVTALAESLGLPTRLGDIGIDRAQFAAIAEVTMHDPGLRNNPRPIHGADDIVEILERAA